MLAQRRIKRDLEALQGDLNKLLDDYREVASTEADNTTQQATGGKVEQLRKVIDRAEESAKRLRGEMVETSKKVEKSIEDHPIASVCTALGVGFLLGKFSSPGMR